MAELNHKGVIEALEELGFSQHEAAVYILTLAAGEISAGTLLEETGLHSEQLYRALRHLCQNGLITGFNKGRRNHYTAVDPQVILDKQQAKIELARSALLYLQQLRTIPTQLITINSGNKALEDLFLDILTTCAEGGEYLVIGAAGDMFYNEAQPFLTKFSRLFAKQGITARMTAYADQDYQKEIGISPGIKMRQLNYSMPAPTSTVIYGDKIVIELLDPQNFTTITIENNNLAASYRNTFEILWDEAHLAI